MAVLNRGFSYQPIIRPYVAAPVDQFREALDERSSVYDKNISEVDQLDILASNIDVLDPDKELKQAEIDRIRKGLQEVSSVGGENATSIVRKMARDFASNSDLRMASEKFGLNKQREEDLRQLRLKGITPLDFTSEYRGIKETPDWAPSIESANDFLIDAKKYVGTIKERFKDLGLTFKQIDLGDGVTRTIAVTGDGKEVTNEMLEARAGEVIDEFVKSPTGGNQFYRWNEHQGQDPREAARQMLLTAGLEQVGASKNVNYSVVENDAYVRDNARELAKQNAIQYSMLDNPSEVGEQVTGGDTFGNESPTGGFSGWWDKQLLRFQTKAQTGGKGFNNESVREEVAPNLKRAFRVSNPSLSEEQIESKVNEYFSNPDQFVLDNPEVEKVLSDYGSKIVDPKLNLRLTSPGTLNTLERPIDKNFSGENIVKDIYNNIESKVAFIIKDGKVVPYTDELRALKTASKTPDSGYKLDMDFAGVVDVENPFGLTDESSRDPNQSFYQPYAVSIVDDKGEEQTVYISRSEGDRPYGTTEDKGSLMAMNETFNKTNRNYGEYMPITKSPIPGNLEVVAIPVGGGKVIYKAKGTMDVAGTTVKIQTTDEYSTPRGLINHLLHQYNVNLNR